MNEHTPGPWFVQVTGGLKECVTAQENGLWATVEGMQRIENARLIAASPDLLAALKMALEAPDNDRSWEDDAIAAIKKADPFWEDPLVN